MTDKDNNGAQNIDGVLEQLKKSYSDESSSNDDVINSESASNDVSHDELQARLRSQFLGEDSNALDANDEDESEDNYVIDEDFLNDASTNYEGDDYIQFEFDEDNENKEEKDYGLFEENFQDDEKIALEEENNEEIQDDKEATLYQKFEEELQEEHQNDEKIIVDEGFQTLQEEQYNEADEEAYATEEDKEIQEGSRKSIQIIPKKNQNSDYSDDDSLWNEEEHYSPITLDDVDEAEESSTFELTEDTRTDAERAGDNYIGMFYRSNEVDPYGNMSFKDRISENAPTVESLEAELDKASGNHFNLNDAFNSELEVPSNEEEQINSNQSEQINSGEKPSSSMEGLDRSDVALLLEFGYQDDVLRNVSNEQAEDFSNEELFDEVAEESGDNQAQSSDNDDLKKSEENHTTLDDKKRFEKLKNRLSKQYDSYRKKRNGIFVRLIISAVIALVLFAYELISALDVGVGGIFDRDTHFVAFMLIGLQMLVFAALPAIKSIYESFQRLFVSRIDAYFLAGVSLLITIIYDFIAVFERKEIPPTFHFCAALIVVFAELSELMRVLTEIKSFEYYFLEYLFDDVSDMEKIKYTLVKSEGKNSIAEKMYQGGLDAETEIYFPQSVDVANGFFDASDVESTKNRATFGWIAASVVAAFILTIVSGIIYEEVWIAAATFIITFNLMMPITALIAEWLPFYRLSKQNYSYGAAFACEGSAEQIDKCDMLIFGDLHIFEPCDSKSVNLAIYDSTSKAVLLSCLSSVYSEIGGPLKSAFSNLKVQPIGKCRINRVAKSGVEAFVGSSYSVLIGDEQFMSRYGIAFPDAALSKLEDKIFTLCVSINNRPTARIAVKYKMNETFYNIIQKLTEDKISCTVQTYDPMISAELISRVRPFKGAPINVVHKSANDFELEQHEGKTGALYSVMGEDLCVMSRGSRLNLAVALSNAKKLKKLRKLLNICSGVLIGVGAIAAMMLVLSEKLMTVSWLFVFIYWLISGALLAAIMVWKFSQRDRFIFKRNKK